MRMEEQTERVKQGWCWDCGRRLHGHGIRCRECGEKDRQTENGDMRSGGGSYEVRGPTGLESSGTPTIHPAETTVPRSSTLRKACRCSPSTASGPRWVNVRSIWASDPVRFFLKLVRMACDVCDTTWEESGG
jgi:hypothetical protein